MNAKTNPKICIKDFFFIFTPEFVGKTKFRTMRFHHASSGCECAPPQVRIVPRKEANGPAAWGVIWEEDFFFGLHFQL